MSKSPGDCYQAAFDTMLHYPAGDLRLAHGTCTGQGPIAGVAFGHAWLELADGTLVFDVANGRHAVLAKAAYYRIGKCRKVKLYTRHEAMRMAVKHRHYGPWDRETKKAVHAKKPVDTQRGR